MLTISCPKCNDGDIEFDLEEGSNDGLGRYDTWLYALYVKHNCGCEFSNLEMEKMEEEASERAEEPPEPDVYWD
jgi:hypothetical protein